MNILIGLIILACAAIITLTVKIYMDHKEFNKLVISFNGLKKDYGILLEKVRSKK